MFGWHVHEKAILLVLVPLSLLAADSQAYFRTFMIASTAGIFSLFPLLFTPAESFIKVVYSVLWAVFVFEPLNRQVYEFPPSLLFVLLDASEKLYLTGFPLLQLFVTLFPILAPHLSSFSSTPQLCKSDRMCLEPTAEGLASMEFLPLMLTSVYCAVGLVWAFLRLSYIYVKQK